MEEERREPHFTEARNELVEVIILAAQGLHDPYFGEVAATRGALQAKFAAYEKALLRAAGVVVKG